MPDSELAALLALLDIERVLVIDDEFTPPASVYTMNFDDGDGPTLTGLPARPEGTAYEEHVQEHWPQVPVAEKLEVRKQARKVDGYVEDSADPTGLRELADAPYFRGMTLHEWNGERDKLLADHRRALILFDVNFAQETGEEQGEEGLGPAGETLNGAHHHIVGLLSTKVRAGEEDDAAAGWAPRARVARAGLVVVNKNLLSDPDNEADIATVVEQIRSTIQASQLGRVREKVREALQRSLTDAETAISESSPSALEDVVFRSSRDGGEWEGDTWFRLYGTLGLASARRDVALDPSMRRAIADVRNLVHHGPGGAHKDSATLARRVEQAEAYRDVEYVNHAGLPIENGDIFKTKDGRAFILTGQPCDLMLRPEGRARAPQSATLLLITPADGERGADESSAFTLPPGAPLADRAWEVRFRPEFHVAFDVLDLVSLNTAGRATLRAAKGTRLAPLLPGLQTRLETITTAAAESATLLAPIEQLAADGHLTEARARALRHRILDAGGPFKATLGATPTPFAFDCQRIGRLAGSYADALLVGHSAARARTAHAHELTRIVADERSP
jgi:hypothetical protein